MTGAGVTETTLLARLARERFEPVWLHLDRAFGVRDVTGDPRSYGYTLPPRGGDARASFDFLYGVDPREHTHLELVETPNRRCVDVDVEPACTGCTVLLTDTTAEREQHRRLQQKTNEVLLLAERQAVLLDDLERLNAVQAHFIANMSHEFRTPLASIVAHARFLEDAADPAAAGDGLYAIRRAALHLMNLVDNLIDEAQFEIDEVELRPVPLRMQDLLDDVVALFRPLALARGMTFTVTADTAMPAWVVADETRLRQILVNVIGNACKYTRTGGVTVELAWSDGRLEMTVTDTGPGMDADTLARVYEPFQRAVDAPGPGAGLGLCITRRLVELMDGAIAIDTAPGRGTRVCLHVAAPAHTPPPANGAAGEAVVVIDDDTDVYDILAFYLDEAGYSVYHADSGTAALEVCATLDVHAVVMDRNLPDTSGFDLVQSLRACGYDGPVVMLTASNLGSDRARAQAAGCSAFLVKPVAPERLVACLRDHAGRAHGRPRDG